jgi:hypothetical protein
MPSIAPAARPRLQRQRRRRHHAAGDPETAIRAIADMLPVTPARLRADIPGPGSRQGAAVNSVFANHSLV